MEKTQNKENENKGLQTIKGKVRITTKWQREHTKK